MVYTETVQLALIIPYINNVLQSAFHNHKKSIIRERADWQQSHILLNQPHSHFSNTVVQGSTVCADKKHNHK